MHSFWMFLSVATLCTLLATAEARDYLMDGILKYLESRTPKQQQQAMTTDMEKEQKYFASEDELNKVRRCNQHDKITAAACGCLFSMVHSSVLISWITNIGVWNHYWYYCYNTTNQYLATQKIITFMQQVTIALVQTFCGALSILCRICKK